MKPVLGFVAIVAMLGMNSAGATCVATRLSPVGDLPGENGDPAVVGSSIYAAYNDDLTGLMLAISQNSGSTWSASTVDPAGRTPRIVSDGERVYMIWYGPGDATPWALWLLRSPDGGQTFDRVAFPAATSMPANEAAEPQIAAAGLDLSLIFFGSGTPNMTVATSHDGGTTFQTIAIPLRYGSSAGEETLAIAGPKIAVGWAETGPDGLRKTIVSTSGDGGQSFAAPQDMTPSGLGDREPLLAFSEDGAMLYRVARRTAPHNPALRSVGMLSASADLGSTWSTVSVDPATSLGRQWSILPGEAPEVHVTYLRADAQQQWWAQLATSADNGTTFTTPMLLGSGPLAIKGKLGSEAHGVRGWSAGANASYVYDVGGILRYRATADNGSTWSAEQIVGAGDNPLVNDNAVAWLGTDRSVNLSVCQ